MSEPETAGGSSAILKGQSDPEYEGHRMDTNCMVRVNLWHVRT